MSRMSPITVDSRFGWLHTPEITPRNTAVVVCPGLKYDELTGYSSLRQLSDAFADRGYPTLRLHYSGTGNSCDPVGHDYWAAWQHDIHAAADWLRAKCHVQQLVLCGLRFGTVLATTVAADRTDVAGLILMAPILRGRSYMRQLIMESGTSNDGHVDLGRIQMQPDTIASINQFELRRTTWQAKCKAAVFFQSASAARLECEVTWKKAGIEVTSQDFTGLEPMLRPTFAIHEDPAIVDPVLNWLSSSVSTVLSTTGGNWMGEDVELKPDGCVETPLRFGTNHDLFGMLCRPDQTRSHVMVLMGNSSGDPHCAGAAVGLARSLAAEGVASLRFDFPGIGDSLAATGGSHVFETDRSPIFSAAIDALESLGYREFAAQGLCSGAYHAYHAAVADRRIKSVLLVNLPFFKWMQGFPVEELSFDLRPPSHFVQLMQTKVFWINFVHKMLRGELNVRRRFASIETKLGRFPEFVQDPEAAIELSRRVKMLFLVSKGDVSIEVLKRTFGRKSMPPGAKIELVPELDHAMTGSAMRDSVAKRMAQFLTEQQVVGSFRHARGRKVIMPLLGLAPSASSKPLGLSSD